MNITNCQDQAIWDEMVRHQAGHPLQLWGWGELKAAHRWQAHRLLITNQAGQAIGGAQVLQRRLPKPFGSLLYIPRGPVGPSDELLPLISDYCRRQFHATHLTIEPHQTAPITAPGWRPVKKTILLAQTIILDLTRSEAELMADMSKKTRQYIRKSQKDGVMTRRGERADIAACLEIYRQTAARAGFGLHQDQYYYDIYDQLGADCKLFVAEVDGQIAAFVWLVATDEVAFELYGGMNQTGQAARANYCLKWFAMRSLKVDGVRSYDVNGLLNDGVSAFKRGFCAHETKLAGSYDYRLSIWYWPWRYVFPVAKKVLQLAASLRK